ncbi:hypothetical protein SAMN05421753_11377 [Planctomicrobium piriforme]|uniref:Uncharacterized protein n=2 Tax=Planctomicrobium piriforme TaxID=1576369 RepID=A0A1I3LVG4_9PLAN|nr:hypothetical protein SAMN05421753_11377 [Planctomicrobium piriforme]
MAATKKLLISFDPSRPDSRKTDILIPWDRDSRRVLWGLNSGKEAELGVMIYVGQSISENDLFARLIDSGATISDIESTMTLLRSYVAALSVIKVGGVARVAPVDQAEPLKVDLELVAKSPAAYKS